MKAIHVYNPVFSKNPDTNRRHIFAAKTWKFLYSQGIINCPVESKDLKRTGLDIGDTRDVPFVKDLIEYGIEKHNPDVIILTNTDCCVSRNTAARIQDVLLYKDACLAKRWNFDKLTEIIPDDKIPEGKEEEWGYDLFAFKVSWWNKYKDKFSDLLLGTELWDMIFGNLIILTNYKTELQYLIYHEKHEQFWNKPENKYVNPGQVHNLTKGKIQHHKLQLLYYLRKIDENPQWVFNDAIKYEIQQLKEQGIRLVDLL